MLSDQARLARVLNGEEHDVKFRNAFEELVDNMSLCDKGLMVLPNFSLAYEDKTY
ncbi:MAG: hypothetical protein V1734_04470 [Nanoarchaeota archaeon]